MPTAQISLNVTAFNDISNTTALPRWCVLGSSGTNPVIPAIALTPDPSITGKVSIVGSTIVTSGNAAINFEFTILPANTYSALGIAFQQTAQGSGNADPQGNINFDPPGLSHTNSAQLTINNKRNRIGGAAWKFYIWIQNASGAMGIIDPGIQNDN